MSGSHPPVSVHVQPCPPTQRRTQTCAPAGPQPLLQSCQGSGGSTLRCRPLRTIASASAPSAALFREGRRRRDGATGTTGTGLLLATTARSIMPAEGSKRIGCTLPGAHRCARSEPARGSARLLTARTSARPDFPFSRLISRLDCAQSRTGSAVRMGPTAACRAHNGRAVGTSQKRLRRERQALLRAPSTRHQANREGPSAAFLRAALRTFRPTRTPSWCRSCAPEARRSACNRRRSTCSLTFRLAAKRKGWKVVRVEGKIKGLSALGWLLIIITALAALTWGASRHTKVIRKEEGKVKATEAVLLQLPAGSADAATCRLLDRLTFASLARKCRSDRQLK